MVVQNRYPVTRDILGLIGTFVIEKAIHFYLDTYLDGNTTFDRQKDQELTSVNGLFAIFESTLIFQNKA